MSDYRLGDVIDDHCIKCRRVTNHSIVSLVTGAPAKVRCRTCYHDHDYRFEQAPPSKKDLKKAELFKEVLASVDGGAANAAEAEAAEAAAAEPVEPVEVDPAETVPETPEVAVAPAPAKKGKARGKKA